jgi:RHS repeat-associated protein
MAKNASHTQWYAVDSEAGYQLFGNLDRFTQGYVFVDSRTELIYTFKSMPTPTVFAASIAPVTRIQDRNGNALVFANDTSGRVTRIEDGQGRLLNFTYAEGKLAQVADQGGRAIRFSYTNNRLAGFSDALGNITAFTYAPNAPVIGSQTLPRGNIPYKQTYSSATVTEIEPNVPRPGIVLAENTNTATIPIWRVDTQTDALGNVMQFKFDDKGGTTITDALGNKTQDTHKDNRLLTQWQDPSGKAAKITYDDQGRRVAITDRLGDTTKFTYHAQSGNLASYTNAQGNTISKSYAPSQPITAALPNGDQVTAIFFDLTKIDYPDKTSEQFTYDAKGNVLTHVDRTGQTWKFIYNARGQLLTSTNSSNGVVTYTYNDDSTLASSKDSDTGETKYGYDTLKRLNKITYANNSVEQIAYDENNRITTYTDAANRMTKFEYDANGNLVKQIDANGKAITYEYDAMDRVTQVTDRTGQVSKLSYDKLGNISAVIDATGVSTQFAYDPRGWLNAIMRGDATWKASYDDEGVATAVASPLGNATKLQTDKLGMLTGATDALGNSGALTRDALNRVTGTTDALKRATNYTYDARDALTDVTLPVVGASKYEYDALGNLTKITDLNGGEWKLTYSPMGRLQTATDPLGKATQYKYDTIGRLSEITLADGVKQTVVYDSSGNLLQQKSSDGFEQKFVYDALNRLTDANGVKLAYDAESRIVSTDDPAGRLNSTATYDAAGRLKTVAYGAVTVTYNYDAKTGLLTSVSDNVTKAQVDFTYDKDNRLIGMARSNKVNTTLTWDNASQLTSIKDGNITNLQYTLDAAGQVTSAKITAPTVNSNFQTPTFNFQFDAASQVSSNGYKYDARGRLIESPNGTLKWDSVSQLVGIGQTTLTYNGLGDVASHTDGTATVRYGYNYALGLAPIVAETNATASIRYYVWTPGGALLYAIENDKPLFYHFDRTGSTLVLTDANGAVTDAYAYDPYGKMLGHNGKSTQPFTYVGEWGVRQESATLYQMRARYYDATTARFISREPLFPQIDDPRLLNSYAYAIGNPLRYIDPTGNDIILTGKSKQALVPVPETWPITTEQMPNAARDVEFNFGYARELFNSLHIDARYIKRWEHNLVEDNNEKSGILANPENQWPITTERMPRAARDDAGVEFTLNKRYSTSWQMNLPYTYGRREAPRKFAFGSSENAMPSGTPSVPDFWMLNLGIEKTLKMNERVNATLVINGWDDIPARIFRLGAQIEF